MDVKLLNGFSVSQDGAEFELGGRKPRTLLAVLAAHSPGFVTVDRCIEAVWGEDASSGAKRSLQTYVSTLRSVIDPERVGKIEGSDDGYRLVLGDGDRLDLGEFRDLASSGKYSEALGLWGEPLGDLAYDEWAQPLVREWTGDWLAVLERWADGLLEAGAPAEVVSELERITAAHPHHEGLTARLMTALYQTGRQADALDRYRSLTVRLGEDLGVEPSPELQDLEERILLHDPSLQRRQPTPTNVEPVTDVVGRSGELETLERLLDSTRLLTITGAGGTGKTTIARMLAERVLDRFRDGVWWLSLAPFGTAEVVPNELLGSMRQTAPADTDPMDAVATHLGSKDVLLVFDNCEHLVEPMTDIIGRILRSSSGTVVLATSREQLQMAGEVSWRLPTLAVPDRAATDASSVAGCAAAALFAVRASRAQSGFAITDENAGRVASICRRLDGLPLAIELAAAQVGAMGLGELEGRLDDRFAVLTDSGGDATHQRTLWETVAWSYDLLAPDHQELYRRLAVFRGGFDLAAAEAVSPLPETVDALDALALCSLVVLDMSRVAPRYVMLETIRQHAMIELERHDETDTAHQAHLSWAVDLVREGSRHLEGPDIRTWTKRYRLEMDNFRAALSYAAKHDPVAGARLTAGLSRFWWGHATDGDPVTLDDATSFLQEGRAWVFRMLEAAGSDLPAKDRARLLTSLGGLLEIRLGRFTEAVEHLEEAIAALEDLDEPRLVAWAEFYRGMAAWGIESSDEIVSAMDRAASLGKETGDVLVRFSAVLMRGWAHLIEGRSELARADFEKVVGWAENSGNASAIAHADDAETFLSIMQGRTAEDATTRITKVIQRFRRMPNYACIAHGLHTAAAWLAREGRLEESATTMGVVQGIRDRLNMVVPPYEDRTPMVDDVGLGELDESQRADLFASGRAMTPDDGIDWVMGALTG